MVGVQSGSAACPVRVQLVKGPCSCVRSPKRNPSRLSFVPSSVWCVASFSLVIIKKVTTRRVKNIRREKRNYSQHSLLSCNNSDSFHSRKVMEIAPIVLQQFWHQSCLERQGIVTFMPCFHITYEYIFPNCGLQS